MQKIVLKPEKKRMVWLALQLALVTCLGFFVPALTLPAALILPLFTCPLGGKKQEGAAACASCMLAAAAYPFYGWSGALGAALMTLLPLYAAMRKREKQSFLSNLLLYFCGTAAGLLLCLFSLTDSLSRAPALLLAEKLADLIHASPRRAEILVRMGNAGLLRFPPECIGQTAEALARNPGLIAQMSLSARGGLTDLLEKEVPRLCAAAVLGVPLFTAVRVNRYSSSLMLVRKDAADGKKHAVVIVPPGFRIMKIPRGAGLFFLLLPAAGLMLLGGVSPFEKNLGLVFLYGSAFLWEMQGAAVMIFRMAPKPEQKGVFAGIAAAFFWLLTPEMLLLLGLTDHFFPLRKLPQSTDK